MIPIQKVRIYIEKNAGVSQSIGKGIGRGAGSAASRLLRTAWKHPYITAGLIGGVVVTKKIADNILSSYHILNEQRKRGSTKKQIELLQDIANKVGRDTVASTRPRNGTIINHPLF